MLINVVTIFYCWPIIKCLKAVFIINPAFHFSHPRWAISLHKHCGTCYLYHRHARACVYSGKALVPVVYVITSTLELCLCPRPVVIYGSTVQAHLLQEQNKFPCGVQKCNKIIKSLSQLLRPGIQYQLTWTFINQYFSPLLCYDQEYLAIIQLFTWWWTGLTTGDEGTLGIISRQILENIIPVTRATTSCWGRW